ncbi:unnamed protein product [Thlaspi arvense]|uniref:RBR-type E3 ubiquitin transferase n=1 Tax=Thlaspi arvense TaxID=13288 RepID=A0AAU9RTZ2_THLAR|nr:unnamed protein product [Thlaspi arvense]
MAAQSVNAAMFDLNDLPGDVDEDGDSSDCFIFSTTLSSRGSTKHDAISVENYDQHRRLRNKSEPPIFIDLDQYNNGEEDDDDLRILCFPPILEKGQSSKSKPLRPLTFYCEICVESKPIIESFPINGCSHSYCNDCVSKYVAAKLQDNLLSIDCPVTGCYGRLEPDQCRLILPREVFDRWGDALCEAVMMRSNRFYCPYKDCSALVFFECEDEKMKESECPHCNRMVCVRCGTKWHPEITCEEFQMLGENERERDDILLKKMAENHKWRRCPSCKFYIEKSQGCLYMKCRCGLAFCYNCGTPSKDTSHYCYSCKH